MSRNEKIQKLVNAIKVYRGICDPVTAGGAAKPHWRIAPQPASQPKVVRWLEELGIDAAAGIEAIHNFPNLDAMDAWIAKVTAPPKTAQERGL